MRRSLYSVFIASIVALTVFPSCSRKNNADDMFLRRLDQHIKERTESYSRMQQADSLHTLLSCSLNHDERFELYGRLLELHRSYNLDSQQFYTERRLEMMQTPFERQMALLNYAEIQMRRGDYPQMILLIDSALQQPLNPALAPYYYQTLYPVMENAYHKHLRRRQIALIGLIVSALIIVMMLVYFLLYVKHKHRQLELLNNRLAQSNEDLRKSNHIKAVYVQRYIKMTSVKDFDEAFLELFPDFVSQVQSLLVPETELHIKPHERLNTDLRVLALIYLGITDSKQIADILRYSISTIYNSRTRMRNLAKEDRDHFEEKIAAL